MYDLLIKGGMVIEPIAAAHNDLFVGNVSLRSENRRSRHGS
jgi:hypothetical protein